MIVVYTTGELGEYLTSLPPNSTWRAEDGTLIVVSPDGSRIEIIPQE